jgi:ArsR family transcriptional regulator
LNNDSLRRFKAEIFQGLAHPTRIAIVEALRNGETPAGRLIEQLQLEQANASQHLSVLRAKRIVTNRKVGNQVLYSLRDPALVEVLDILRLYLSSQLTDTVNLLEEIVPKEPARRWKTALSEIRGKSVSRRRQ